MHTMKPVSEMSFWEKIKMSVTMTMGMEHTGLAGRETGLTPVSLKSYYI